MTFLSRSFSILLFFCLVSFTEGQKEVPPKPTQWVNDYVGVLSPDDKMSLENKLAKFEKNTTNQIAVVIDSTMDGGNVEEYCTRLFNTWGIGRKDRNNGILFYCSIRDQRVRIELGKGIMKYISNARCKKILEENIYSEFMNGEFYRGIDKATDALMMLAPKKW